MMDGWIKLHRKLSEWEWYKEPKTLHLFIHLLLRANYKPSKWRGIDLVPGQILTGRKQLSVETGISERSIRTSLERLKKTGEISIKTSSQYSVITVCNYVDYQGGFDESDQQSDQQATSERPANDHIQEDKKKKKEKREEDSLGSSSCSEPSDSKPKVVGTLPLNDGSEFEVVEDFFEELSSLYPAVDVMQAFRKMKGWFLGNPTKLKTRKGIKRFITNWLGREQDRGGSRIPSTASNHIPRHTQNNLATIQRLMEE